MDDILSKIEQLESESYGFGSGDLAEERAEAIRRYNCEPYGDEVEGRSQVVSSDLRDVVEWIIPQWLRVAMSGDQVVKFTPHGPEDEEQAKQETSFINYVILEKNDALTVLGTWGRDALMSKNGYVKAYWEERSDIRTETYKGLPDDAFSMLLNDKAIELVEHSEAVDPLLGAITHDVKVRRTYPCGYVRIENVPPEELMIHKSTRTTDLQDCLFIQHKTRKSLSEVRMMGYDVPDEVTGDDPPDQIISNERDRFNEETTLDSGLTSNKLVWLKESFLRYDQDDDGVAELRRVVSIGSTVLANEEADLVPIACIVPILSPHRHIGVGYDDLVEQTGIVKTTLMRQGLDNLYLANNSRMGADINRVNIDDLLISRPGGVVRTQGSPGESLMPLVSPNTFSAALEGMQWVDAWRENSTGISAYYQGMNADALNKTATGISQIMSASQQRVEAVIRHFANGFKDLCYIVHALTLKNATAAEKVKLDNNWVVVDPREWTKRTNLSVTVGLGTGTREARVQQLMAQWQLQLQGLQVGICTPENLYQTGKLISEEMGYRNSDEFWADPAKQPPRPQQPPPEVMKAQMQIQADQQKFQAQAQLDQQKTQADAARAQQEAAMQLQLEQEKIQQQAALEKYKADLNAQTQLQIKQMELGINVEMKNAEFQHAVGMKQFDVANAPDDKASDIKQFMGEVVKAVTKPKKVIRDEAGRITGVE